MYRALIVCNSRYPKDPGALTELNGPKADGVLLREALTDPDTGLFDRSEVSLLPEADSPEILEAADEFFSGAEADDVLLFYYSGHGRSLSQELFLCAGNTRTSRLDSSAVASSTLSRMITRSFAQVKMVILDCCHGGGFKGGELIDGLSGKGRFVIAAASAADQAGDASARGEPSPFTKALVEGLLTEARDSDGDGAVDLDDLFRHVSGTRFDGHEPQRKFDGAGAVPLARRAPEAATDEVPPAAEPSGPDLHHQPYASPSTTRRRTPPRDGVDPLEAAAPQAVLDHTRVQNFRAELREDVTSAYPSQLTTSEFLGRSGLVKDGVPTLSGALLFGENPTAVQPTAMVRCVRFRGTDKTDPTTSTEFHGTLPELIVQARDFVASTARIGELPTTEAARTDALYRFPMIAAREIIANAVVHRDYARTDACVAVHVYDDRVEVISPGAWGTRDHPVPDGQQRLGALERQSQPRNFRLARVLSWAKLVESVGAGLPRSVADCRTVGAPEPVVRLRDGMVTVTLFALGDRTVEPPRASGATVTPASRTERSGGIDPARIAEVLSRNGTHGRGYSAYGTGYRVSYDTVLTAGHLVAEKEKCTLRFSFGPVRWETTAEVTMLDEAADVALLRFSPPSEAEVVPPVRFGRVTREAAVLDVETVGFPRFKHHPERQRVRSDLAHLQGTTSSLTNISSGTLSIRFDATPHPESAGANPWVGMSGGPVWSDGLLIGVINRVLPAEGPGTLGAVRIDSFLTGPVLGLLGIPEPLDLPQVPAPEFHPGSPQMTYVHDIAPQRLTGREEELAALAEFCRGDVPYAMWRGGPWSGKTALTAWFALHPPHDVDVVSFFVNGGLAGRGDAAAFTDAVVDELSWYLGQDRAASSTASGAVDTLRRRLLDTAARTAHLEGRRLLLVVDGIDEDRGPSSGLPSIASLLPGNPPPGLRVLVTSREVPLPDDVPAGHPLRHGADVLLAPASAAPAWPREVRRELLNMLTLSEAHRDILGLIAAAGDRPPPALPELAEMADLAPYELARLLKGPLGRLFVFSDAEALTAGVVRFAYPQLGEEVRQMLGLRLMHEYTQRLGVHRQARDLRVDDPWAG
ncbi:caspase family protein [Streptomyces microflavus]|uniref:caspase, EACC1-associated type n=1 Tax=Streptomyces microflavus TaxID=1919 RepID=UPI0038192589